MPAATCAAPPSSIVRSRTRCASILAAWAAVACMAGCGGGSGLERRALEIPGIAALDGWVRSDGDVEPLDGGEPGTGDLADGRQVRHFVAFSLADVPADARIEQATLRLGFVALVGVPQDLDPVLVERIDLGTDLDGTDFSSAAAGAPTSLLSGGLLGIRQIDVTTLVQLDVDAGRDRHDLRIRLAGGTDGDGRTDFVSLETMENHYGTTWRPRLDVVFERDAP